jgi:thiosulfate/3-mercaptopyruvate sulfurtransferase
LRDTIISALGGGKTGQIRWEEVKRGKRGVVWSCGSGMTAAVGGWAMRVLAAAEERDEGMKVGVYDEVSQAGEEIKIHDLACSC